MKMKLIKDKYSAARGGQSKLLDICCDHCKKHLFYYQKDGPGALKRMYIDRICEFGEIGLDKDLVCPNCGRLLAIHITFEKENRPALRLFVGSIIKKAAK